MNRPAAHRFPRYGVAGLVALGLMHAAVLCGQIPALAGVPWWWITANTTPICWWAYIAVIDAWIYRREGNSWLINDRPLVALQCILSVPFWCLFEGYNRLMPGWSYVNLPEDLSWRMLGYAIAFATIMPGLFLTCRLLQGYRVCSRVRGPTVRWDRWRLRISVWVGVLFCLAPPFAPTAWRGWLWAFVWTGWFLLLEPFNYRRGMPSIYRDWERGDWSRTVQLFATGALCGLLWEFWNMWAFTKWVYTFAPGLTAKYFEMPWVGFLGFLPFALEYFVMFHFLAGFFTREDKLGL
jgi:hypothetical protein